MKKPITTLILLICASIAAAQISQANLALLDSLDTALEQSGQYEAAKAAQLERATRHAAAITEPEEKFWAIRNILLDYSYYDSDSALVYSCRAIDLADRLGRNDWKTDMMIQRAYVLSATGLLSEAWQCPSDIDMAALPPRQFLQCAETKLFIQTHSDLYMGATSEIMQYTQATDSLLGLYCKGMPQNDPDYYWITGWRSLHHPDSARAKIPQLERFLENSQYNTRQDAKLAWLLGAMYKATGEQELWLRNLILSAIADARSSVKEIASLEELAEHMYDVGDLDHANTYINAAIRCANDYKSRIRVGRLAELQFRISEAYQKQSQAQQRQINRYLAGLIVILLLLTATLGVIMSQVVRIRRRERQLAIARDDLSKRVDELQDAREQLQAANRSLSLLYAESKENAQEIARTTEDKERYIADVFAICSGYIDKLDEFRKKVNRLIIAGRFDEVHSLTKTPELSHSELKELYSIFDRIFLQIYPDFVADFNTLLLPEWQIEPRKGESLNTELRIYALVRLGLNDSVKIARFLHCSVQTVYNTRQRTRNKSAVPHKEFAQRVQNLGKPAI